MQPIFLRPMFIPVFIAFDSNQKFYETIERAVQRGLLYHIFFWIVFYLFLVIADPIDSLSFRMVKTGIRLIFYISVVTFNIYYLFPRFLKTDRLYTYLLIFVSLAVTPIEVILHYLLLTSNRMTFAEAFTLNTNANYFLGIFFIAFSSSIYQIINDWMEHRRERKELQRQQLKSELKFLKTQINPHFFFNTLNSLYALTLKKSDKAPEIVLKLSEMMRYMLYDSNERLIPLSQEIKYLKNYLELEKLRHGENFNMNIQINGDPDGHQIAPLLFMPFLENSFKHGIDGELKSGFVDITLDINENNLDLRVVNSKPQMAIKPIPLEGKSGGIGLTNVRRRLNLLYPKKYNFNIGTTESEYQINLILEGTKKKIKT